MASKGRVYLEAGQIGPIGSDAVVSPTFSDPGQDALTRAVCNHHRRETAQIGCLSDCPLRVCVRTMLRTDGLRTTLEEIRNGKI